MDDSIAFSLFWSCRRLQLLTLDFHFQCSNKNKYGYYLGTPMVYSVLIFLHLFILCGSYSAHTEIRGQTEGVGFPSTTGIRIQGPNSGDQIKIFNIDSKHLYLLSHFVGPILFFWIFKVFHIYVLVFETRSQRATQASLKCTLYLRLASTCSSLSTLASWCWD